MKYCPRKTICLIQLAMLLVWPSKILSQEKSEDHPLVKKVNAYRQANADHDTARVQALLAKGAARWYEKKEGPGSAIKPAGKGPWSDWDEYFKGSSQVESYKVDSNQVTIRVMEINDFYRLIERGPAPTNLTYYFDAEGKIAGILIFRDAKPKADRFDEFKKWAEKKPSGRFEIFDARGRDHPDARSRQEMAGDFE
jgi:hypothetical protein